MNVFLNYIIIMSVIDQYQQFCSAVTDSETKFHTMHCAAKIFYSSTACVNFAPAALPFKSKRNQIKIKYCCCFTLARIKLSHKNI